MISLFEEVDSIREGTCSSFKLASCFVAVVFEGIIDSHYLENCKIHFKTVNKSAEYTTTTNQLIHFIYLFLQLLH